MDGRTHGPFAWHSCKFLLTGVQDVEMLSVTARCCLRMRGYPGGHSPQTSLGAAGSLAGWRRTSPLSGHRRSTGALFRC